MSDLVWEWAVPLTLYALGLLHHFAAWTIAEKQAAMAARQQKQYEMLREAVALKQYGAEQEAYDLLDEALALPEVR